MENMEDKVINRLEDLKKEREDFLEQANSQISFYNVAITELEKLINPVIETEINIDETLKVENDDTNNK